MFKKSLPTMASLMDEFTGKAKAIAEEQTRKIDEADAIIEQATSDRSVALAERNRANKFIKSFEAMLK